MAQFGSARGLATVLGLALFTTSLAAQSMTVTPGAVLTAGSTATISYHNPSKAGQTVIVTVRGGFPIVITYEVPIQVSADGTGTGSWIVVGGWGTAAFNGPDVHEVMAAIK